MVVDRSRFACAGEAPRFGAGLGLSAWRWTGRGTGPRPTAGLVRSDDRVRTDGHRGRVLGQLAADRSMPFVCVQPRQTSWARRTEGLTVEAAPSESAADRACCPSPRGHAAQSGSPSVSHCGAVTGRVKARHGRGTPSRPSVDPAQITPTGPRLHRPQTGLSTDQF
jgi:hypothetical protein